MRKTAFFCLISIMYFCGCHTQKNALKIGYVPGPFFHYGQASLSESRCFELGDIPPEVSTITTTIPFSNRGGGLLEIEEVEGLSSGFLRWEGDNQIAPGQQGMITVLFDKGNFGSGSATCSVLICTNDPGNSKITLFFNFNVIE